jgi:hypothetical protein
MATQVLGLLTALLLLAYAGLGQESAVPTLRSASTLVAVPAELRNFCNTVTRLRDFSKL